MLSPIEVVGLSNSAINMGKETKLADHGEEEGPPFGVVRCLHIKKHGDVRLDTGLFDSLGGESYDRHHRRGHGWGNVKGDYTDGRVLANGS